MRLYNGGITSPKGYTCSTANRRHSTDLYPEYAMLRSRAQASVAMIVPKKTTDSIRVSRQNLAYGVAETVFFDRVTANVLTPIGRDWCEQICEWAERIGGVISEHTVYATVGIRPDVYDIDVVKAALDDLFQSESDQDSEFRRFFATDMQINSVAIEFEIGGKECRIGGIIGNCLSLLDPLVITLTTDVSIDAELLKKALNECYHTAIEGICRPSEVADITLILANGLAENPEISSEDIDYCVFVLALRSVMTALRKCYLSKGDKEYECEVCGGELSTSLDLAKAVLDNDTTVRLLLQGRCPTVPIVISLCDYVDSDKWSDVNIAIKSRGGAIDLVRYGECVEYNDELLSLILTCERVLIAISIGDADTAISAYKQV